LQHGPVECLLDTVEGCAIDIWPEPVTIALPLYFTLFLKWKNYIGIWKLTCMFLFVLFSQLFEVRFI
jgi:hypothetical protein